MALLWQTHKAFCGRANHSHGSNPDLRVLEKGRLERKIFAESRYAFPDPCAKGRDGKFRPNRECGLYSDPRPAKQVAIGVTEP